MHLYGNAKSSSVDTNAKNSAKKTKLGSISNKLGLDWSKKHLKEAQLPPEDASKTLVAKHTAIRVLLDTGSNGDLLFLEKGSNKYIPVVSRAVPESWSTSNGTFKNKKVGEVEISFVEYSASASKKVQLCPVPGYSGVPQRRPATVVQPNHWQANLTWYRPRVGLQRKDKDHHHW